MKPIPHHLFVDNDIYGDINDEYCVYQTIVASIEAIYILLSESDLAKRSIPNFI